MRDAITPPPIRVFQQVLAFTRSQVGSVYLFSDSVHWKAFACALTSTADSRANCARSCPGVSREL